MMWGQHLIMDCIACDIEQVTDEVVLRTFLKELVPAIDMKAYGEPIVKHFSEHTPGWTIVQLIETSSITGHFVDSNGDAYLDIFSCKKFDVEIVSRMVQEFFIPEKVETTVLYRGRPDEH